MNRNLNQYQPHATNSPTQSAGRSCATLRRRSPQLGLILRATIAATWTALLFVTFAAMPARADNTELFKPFARQLEQLEQKSLTPYRDQDGRWRIGLGVPIDDPSAKWGLAGVNADLEQLRDGRTKLSPEQLQCLTTVETARSLLDCQQRIAHFERLTDGQKLAVLHVRFTAGPRKFATMTAFHNALAKHDLQEAVDALRKSDWYDRSHKRSEPIIKALLKGASRGSTPTPSR